MARVSTDFKLARGLTDRLTQREAKIIGEATVYEMKKMIASGQSPVKGEGRFPAYAAQRKGKGRYPDSVRKQYPSKRRRPVNLFLSGDYLKYLRWWLPPNKGHVGIGFTGNTGKKTGIPASIRDKFLTHNEGQDENVPQRKHLPNAQGDQFARSVTSAYFKAVERVIAIWITEMNNKK